MQGSERYTVLIENTAINEHIFVANCKCTWHKPTLKFASVHFINIATQKYTKKEIEKKKHRLAATIQFVLFTSSYFNELLVSNSRFIYIIWCTKITKPILHVNIEQQIFDVW